MRRRGVGRNALDVSPNTRQLQQHHDDADEEVDGAQRLRLGRHRQRQAALLRVGSEDLFVLKDEISDAAVKYRDEEADRQPGEFQEHAAIVERDSGTLNQAKCLAGAALARFLYNRHRRISSGFYAS